MRPGLVTVGLVIAIVGGVLAYLPIGNQSVANSSVTSQNGPSEAFGYPGQLDLINPSIGYTVTWNATASITVTAYDCGSDSHCGTGSYSALSSKNGTSGTLTFTGSRAHYYGVGVTGPAAVTVTASLPFDAGVVGLVVLGVGVVFLLVGLASERRMKPTPETPATPTGEQTAPQ